MKIHIYKNSCKLKMKLLKVIYKLSKSYENFNLILIIKI